LSLRLSWNLFQFRQLWFLVLLSKHFLPAALRRYLSPIPD
jgi:hypothetical protein